MHFSKRQWFIGLAAGACAALLAGLGIREARASGTVHILVLMEHSVGTPAQAQPYVDKLVEQAKSLNGWDAAEGKYTTTRRQADDYISASSPDFGILSLGAFLNMRASYGLSVVGAADVETAGGRTFYIISKNASDLAGCKGKKLASNHLNDHKFINRVVAGGAFTLGDFDLMKVARPVAVIKKVIKGDAECALVDNAQEAELRHIEGGDSLRSVWESAELPPMAVVAFSGASGAERAKFKASLDKLCEGAGKTHCDKVGIRSIRAADRALFSGVIAKYEQK